MNETAGQREIDATYSMRTHFLEAQRVAEYDRNHTRTLGQRFRLALELRLIRMMVLRALRAEPGGRASTVLDVPCGTGRHGAMLAGLGLQVCCMDASPAMVEYARTRPGLSDLGVLVVTGDIEHLPLADDSLALAVSVRLLRHMPPPSRWDAVAELARVSRQGVVFDLLLRRGLVSMAKRILRPQGGAARRPTLEAVRAALHERGLKIRAMRSPRPGVTQQHFFWVR